MISVFIGQPEEVSIAFRLLRESLRLQHPDSRIFVARPDWMSVKVSGPSIILDTLEYRQSGLAIDPLCLATQFAQAGPVAVVTDDMDFDIADPRITRLLDIRHAASWFHFLKKHVLQANINTRAMFRVLQENRHLTDGVGKSLREAMTSQLLRRTGKRKLRALRVYRLFTLMTRAGNPVRLMTIYFQELASVVGDELLLGVVSRFLQRCISVQCGNRTYLKSQIARLIRSYNREHSASTILLVLDFMRRSPYPADATFGMAMHMLGPSDTARSVFFGPICLMQEMSGRTGKRR